tara:strand:- start:323 stop:631 length:309 start_codon:yes stop_codon:yes gene_type:complete
MADSKSKIKASFTPPTHKVVDGVKIKLTNAEIDTLLDEWTDNEHARQVDIDTNGYIYDRVSSYPAISDQLDLLYHDMTAGKGDKTGEWYKAIKAVKDANPKP